MASFELFCFTLLIAATMASFDDQHVTFSSGSCSNVAKCCNGTDPLCTPDNVEAVMAAEGTSRATLRKGSICFCDAACELNDDCCLDYKSYCHATSINCAWESWGAWESCDCNPLRISRRTREIAVTGTYRGIMCSPDDAMEFQACEFEGCGVIVDADFSADPNTPEAPPLAHVRGDVFISKCLLPEGSGEVGAAESGDGENGTNFDATLKEVDVNASTENVCLYCIEDNECRVLNAVFNHIVKPGKSVALNLVNGCLGTFTAYPSEAYVQGPCVLSDKEWLVNHIISDADQAIITA